VARLSFLRLAAGVLGGLQTAGASALSQLSTIQRHQDEDIITDDHGDRVVAACLEISEIRRDMCESIAQHPSALGDADVHHDRGWRMTTDTILDMVGGPGA
jgi:hypothetical protein